MAAPEIRKGPPGPDQLPQGAASDVNANIQAADQAVQTNAPEAPAPQETQPPSAPTAPQPPAAPPTFVGPQPPPKPGNEMESLLFGPMSSQVGVGHALGAPPEDVIGYLPMFARAATAPGAPPTLLAQLRVVLDAIDRQGR